jgi:hypothetical protein
MINNTALREMSEASAASRSYIANETTTASLLMVSETDQPLKETSKCLFQEVKGAKSMVNWFSI